MQDIIFYVAAGETLGVVRDSANARNEPAPVLVRGVSVRLKMRLFAGRDVNTPYPMTALGGIASWSWSMDADYSSGTACKLAADPGAIEVKSVTDAVNGESSLRMKPCSGPSTGAISGKCSMKTVSSIRPKPMTTKRNNRLDFFRPWSSPS